MVHTGKIRNLFFHMGGKAVTPHCKKEKKKKKVKQAHRIEGSEETQVTQWENWLCLVDRNVTIPVFSQKHQISSVDFEYSNFIFSFWR